MGSESSGLGKKSPSVGSASFGIKTDTTIHCKAHITEFVDVSGCYCCCIECGMAAAGTMLCCTQ